MLIDGSATSPSDSTTGTIAIRSADDELETVLEEVLAEHGFGSWAVPSEPRQAIVMLVAQRPAALIVEISRPGPRGESDLVGQLQEDGDLAGIPVLVCGSDMTVVERLARMHGASPTFAALEMPFRMDDLLRLVKELTSGQPRIANATPPAGPTTTAPADMRPR